jgi:hypothetical protein
MPFDKRECPNGHRLLWQNRQTVPGHEAVPERPAEMPENPRTPRRVDCVSLPLCPRVTLRRLSSSIPHR